MEALTAWILALMISLQPAAPWKDTYPHTAEVFAKVAIDAPLFKGIEGPRRTAAEFLSVSWFEGRFNPKAEGDGDCDKWSDVAKTTCTHWINYRSFCTFQISSGNFEWLHVSKKDILGDIEICTRAARRMMKASHDLCQSEKRAQIDWLGWYAVGGRNCTVSKKGQHRMEKARWLFEHNPLPSPEEVVLN